MAPKLTVIGLDAATFSVIDPLVAAGELPNLAALCERGSHGVLRSTTHPLTPHAWATMTTGVNAARHGIWDFSERADGGYHLRLVNGSARRAPAVWDHLSAAGRSCGLVNIPFTWPAPEVEGFAVAGLDAAARELGMTFPATLLGELQQRFGPLRLDHRFPLDRGGSLDLEAARQASEQKVEVALWLAERFQPELLFVVFMVADHVQHLGWAEWEERGAASAVAETYRLLDQAVGRLVATAGTDRDVLVVSDHGAGALQGVANLNAWLAREGYLTFAGREAKLGRRLARGVFELRRRLPEQLRYRVKQRLPRVRERAYDLATYEVIDWGRTKAFAYGTFGNVVVNLRGREALGTVEPGEEYERLRDDLARKLLDLRGPEGEPIVAAVHRREDLFQGPELEKVPDLVVEFRDYAWLGKGNLRTRSTQLWDRIEIEPGSQHSYVGSHRREGIVVLAGPSAGHAETASARIEDIAPTILYLLGQPVPSDLEGRVLTEIIAPGVLAERPPEYGEQLDRAVGEAESYSPEDAAEIESRLRGLGYFE